MAYNNSEIESLLLDTVSRKFLAYNLQDLQCKKCAQVLNFCLYLVYSITVIIKFQIKLENLIRNCQCAGEFRELISKDELLKLLKTFHSLSSTFNMPVLNETMQQLIVLIGS